MKLGKGILLMSSIFLIFVFLITSVQAQIIERGSDWEKICYDKFCETTYYPSRKFYLEDGIWREVNTTFEKGNETWDYWNENNIFKTYVKDDMIRIIGEDGSLVEFRMSFVPLSQRTPIVDKNILSYGITKSYVNATIELALTPIGIEKLITIHNLSLSLITKFVYGEKFSRIGERFKRLGEIFVWDSCGRNKTLSWSQLGDDISFQVAKAWLSNTSCYPVYIDPTIYYNFTDTANNKAYKDESNIVQTPPDWTDDWGGTEASGAEYTNLSSSDNSYAYSTSTRGNGEPYWRFNFTINESTVNINQIYVLVEGYGDYDAGEGVNCYIANFSSQLWQSFASFTTSDATYTQTYTSNFDHFIDNDGQLVLVCQGEDLDSPDNERVVIDFVEVRITIFPEYPFVDDYSFLAWANDTSNYTDAELNESTAKEIEKFFLYYNISDHQVDTIDTVKLWFRNTNGSSADSCNQLNSSVGTTGNLDEDSCWQWLTFINGTDTETMSATTTLGDGIEFINMSGSNSSFWQLRFEIDEVYKPVRKDYPYNESTVRFSDEEGDSGKIFNATWRRWRFQGLGETYKWNVPNDADLYFIDFKGNYSDIGGTETGLHVHLCNATYESGDAHTDPNCADVDTITSSDRNPADVTKFRVTFGSDTVNALVNISNSSIIFMSPEQTDSTKYWMFYQAEKIDAMEDNHTFYSTDNGTTWLSPGTYVDLTHINWLYNTPNGTCFQSFVEVNDTLGNKGNSSINEHCWAGLENDSPSPPMILAPEADQIISNTFSITWTASTDPEGDIFQYNITLLNTDLTENQTIAFNISKGVTSYDWDTTTVLNGNYSMKIEVCENETAELFCASENMTGNFTVRNFINHTFILKVSDEDDVAIDGATVDINSSTAFAHCTNLVATTNTTGHTTQNITETLGVANGCNPYIFKIDKSGYEILNFTADITENTSWHLYLMPTIGSPHIRQWVNVSSYNFTHITYNLSIWTLNAQTTEQGFDIGIDNDWGDNYTLSLDANETNTTSFTKTYVRPNYPSQSEETIVISAPVVNDTHFGNGVQIINPFDPPTKACSIYVEEWRCLNATENGRGCFWYNNLGCQFPATGRVQAQEGEPCLFLKCEADLVCSADKICVRPEEVKEIILFEIPTLEEIRVEPVKYWWVWTAVFTPFPVMIYYILRRRKIKRREYSEYYTGKS